MKNKHDERKEYIKLAEEAEKKGQWKRAVEFLRKAMQLGSEILWGSEEE